MKRMMTTPMANSSMPWIPMTAGQGEPAQGQACTRRPGPGERRKEASGTSDAVPEAGQQQVFSTEGSQEETGIRSGWCMGLFPGPEHSMRTGPAGWTKAALMSTLMLKWKICGSRHIWKTFLSAPMRENGGCVTSHLLRCIKGDVSSHFPDFPLLHTLSGAQTGKDTSYCSPS